MSDLPPLPTFRPGPPSGPLTLDPQTIHVWQAHLSHFAVESDYLLRLLSADEQTRAGRFCFSTDRQHFIIARALLRLLLGRYLNLPPQQLSFTYNAFGKPALAARNNPHALHFNLSHSHGIALYAIARGRELGVDVEYIRPEVATEAIAEHFFSAREVQTLRALPAQAQPQAFFHCWTRKEAFIKARGDGLSFPLDQFDVSLSPEEPAALLGIRPDALEASRWSLHTLPVEDGYVAALATQGHDWQLKCWTLHQHLLTPELTG